LSGGEVWIEPEGGVRRCAGGARERRRAHGEGNAEVGSESRAARVNGEDDDNAGEGEEESVDQVAQHAPELVQEVHYARIEARLPVGRREDEAKANDGEDATHLGILAEAGLGHVEDGKGHGKGANDLDVSVTVGARVGLQPAHHDHAHDDPKERPQDGHAGHRPDDVPLE
jgi:hypothetical protein